MEHLMMSKKERERKVVLKNVETGIYSLKEGAKRLKISYRQALRIKKRYKAEGDRGLTHRNRNRPSNRGICKELEQKILIRYQEAYEGFGPTFASEKLSEEGLRIKPETLRQVLIRAGLWSKKARKYKHRTRRERRARFGDLLQIDGSIHQWFSDDRYTCLLNAVDDASSTSYAIMRKEETTEGVFSLLKGWIEHYGIPKAVYVDRKSVYIGPKKLSEFEKVCKRLGIEVIKAYSPQAKGRVERSHGVYQDRLVKEIKLRQIQSIEEVNELLSSFFVEDLNRRFAKAPAKEESGHVMLEEGDALDDWICWEKEYVLQNDRTISRKKKIYQITSKNKSLRPKKGIKVKEHLDGSLTMYYEGEKVDFKELKQAPEKKKKEKELRERKSIKIDKTHPWRVFNPSRLKQSSRRKKQRWLCNVDIL